MWLRNGKDNECTGGGGGSRVESDEVMMVMVMLQVIDEMVNGEGDGR